MMRANPKRAMDSASLFEADRREALANRGREARPQAQSASLSFSDCAGAACGCGEPASDAGKGFADPGSEHGPSIKCPDIYEALLRKGMSKSQAAAISNARC